MLIVIKHSSGGGILPKEHKYQVAVEWVGNRGTGTSSYTSYDRDFLARVPRKPDISGSADPAFRGDATKWNPEDLLVASVSSCHKLWYLHLCSVAGIVVAEYRDLAEGMMRETPSGGGGFASITLRPTVVITKADLADLARELHHEAHAKCFIANSLSIAVRCEPRIEIAAATSIVR